MKNAKWMHFLKIFLMALAVFLLTCWTAMYQDATVYIVEGVAFLVFTFLCLKHFRQKGLSCFAIALAIFLGRIAIEIPLRIGNFWDNAGSLPIIIYSLIGILFGVALYYFNKVYAWIPAIALLVACAFPLNSQWNAFCKTHFLTKSTEIPQKTTQQTAKTISYDDLLARYNSTISKTNTLLVTVVMLSIIIILLLILFFIYRKNQRLQQLLTLNNELHEAKGKVAELDSEIAAKENELQEKIAQNKSIIKMLHQSELTNSADDVVHAVRQAAEGRQQMTASDWQRLYHAIDELHPDFHEQLVQQLGTFSEQQMQVCYLLRVGFSNRQIQNLTNLSRATVWRWVKKFQSLIEN